MERGVSTRLHSCPKGCPGPACRVRAVAPLLPCAVRLGEGRNQVPHPCTTSPFLVCRFDQFGPVVADGVDPVAGHLRRQDAVDAEHRAHRPGDTGLDNSPLQRHRHRFDAGSHSLRCAYFQVIFVERKCVVPVGVPSEKDT
jgi:hypothetical protein